DQLAAEFDVLKNKQFIAECDGLRQEKGEAGFRKIEAALANPLLPAADRNELEVKYVALDGKSLGVSTSGGPKSSVYERSASDWSKPLFAFLPGDRSAPADDSSKSNTDLNTRWEHGITLLRSNIVATTEGEKATRQDLFDADGRLRSVAVLISRD